MEIRDFKLVSHLAHSQQFYKTAEAFYMSASNLTRRIQDIEAELKISLFERDKRQITLSPDGEEFLRLASPILDQWEALEDHFEDPGRSVTGSIRIYGSVSASYGILPPILESFKKSHPDIDINIETGPIPRGKEKLEKSETDFAIFPSPEISDKDLDYQTIAKIPLILVIKKGQSPTSISKNTLILPKSGQSREHINQWLNKHQLSPAKILEVAEFESILSLASAGYGIGIIPKIVRDQSMLRKKTEIIRPKVALPKLTISIAALSKRLPLNRLKAFWAHLKKT